MVNVFLPTSSFVEVIYVALISKLDSAKDVSDQFPYFAMKIVEKDLSYETINFLCSRRARGGGGGGGGSHVTGNPKMLFPLAIFFAVKMCILRCFFINLVYVFF